MYPLGPVVAMLVVLTISAGSSAAVAVLAPQLGPEAGLEPTAVGVFVAITSVIAGLTGVLSGGIILAWGPIRVLQAGVLAAGAGMLLVTSASPWLLVLAAVLLGCATGPYNPASAQVLTGLTATQWQPFIFSVKQTGVPVGGMLAGAALPVAALTLGWQESLLVVAALAGLVAVSLQPLHRQFPSQPSSARGRSLLGAAVGPVKLVSRDVRLRRLTLCACAYSSTQLTFVAFHTVYLTEVAGWSLLDAGVAFACMQAGGIFGRIGWGLAAGNVVTPERLLIGLGVLTGFGLLALSVLTPDWSLSIVMVVSFLLGSTGMGWNGVLLARVATHAPKGQAAFATGGLQLVMFLGSVVMPPVFALIVSIGGYTTGYVVLAVLIAIGAYTLMPLTTAFSHRTPPSH